MEKWERREVPQEILEQASSHPGGNVYAIDHRQIRDASGYVPPEAIVGCWKVGDDGRPTGEYAANPGHGPITDDFRALSEADHWLGWAGEDPAAEVRRSVEETLREQVTGCVVQWMKVLREPEFLTGGRRDPESAERMVVVRAGLAVEFALSVSPPSGEFEVLVGVYTWVATGLDGPDRRDRIWLDLGMRLEDAKDLLKSRIYEVG